MRYEQFTQRRAFTLVEILIVVVILGILAAIVVPQFADAATATRQSAFATDIKTWAEAATRYQAETGEYLEDSASGDFPAGWDAYANREQWENGTVIGGLWDFELNSFGVRSSFGVHFNGVAPQSDEFMSVIDRIVDDGDLATGVFRKLAADRFYFIMAR